MIPDCFWIDQYPLRDTKWLVDGVLSPHINILSGQPKVGKSTLAMALSLSIINRIPFLDREINASGAVAWMGYDSGWAEELRSKVGNKSKNKLLLQRPFDLTVGLDSQALGSRLKDFGCQLFVVDHLYGFANNHNLDINNQSDATRAMNGIRILNSEFEIPILLIAQASKGHTGALAHSNYLKGLARVLLELTGSSSKGKRNLKVIGNEIESTNIKLTISRDELVTLDGVQSDEKQRDRDFRMMAERAWTALSVASYQDVNSVSAFGRLFHRLGFASTEEGGRKMVQRYLEMGILKASGGHISIGNNLAS